MLCTQCPRSCGALRTDTRGDGLCRMPALPVLARAALHHWEEPPISGTRGSGTIFFSGCSLGCVFCQNEKISHQDFGKPVTIARLRDICQELADQGAHNLNFVNPTHYAHTLRELLENWRPPIPVVWNSGGYDQVDTLRSLEGLVNIYLPDLKYLDSGVAARYSGAPDYPEAAVAALREKWDDYPPPHPARSGGRSQGGYGLDICGICAGDGAFLVDEPVYSLGGSGTLSRDQPPATDQRDAGSSGIYGKSRSGGLYPGANLG